MSNINELVLTYPNNFVKNCEIFIETTFTNITVQIADTASSFSAEIQLRQFRQIWALVPIMIWVEQVSPIIESVYLAKVTQKIESDAGLIIVVQILKKW